MFILNDFVFLPIINVNKIARTGEIIMPENTNDNLIEQIRKQLENVLEVYRKITQHQVTN